MATVEVVNLQNKKVGTMDLSDAVFGQRVNEALVLQVIKAQLAGKRQGTASTKTRREVRGGGKKPFRQKGTGSARQGSTRSPLQPGGGQAHGPKPRKYNQDTPRGMTRGALRSVLSDKLASKHLVVVDKLSLEKAKTKELNNILAKNFKAEKAVLVDSKNENLDRASRNLAKVKFLTTEGVNTYDLVKYDWLILSQESAKTLSERLA